MAVGLPVDTQITTTIRTPKMSHKPLLTSKPRRSMLACTALLFSIACLAFLTTQNGQMVSSPIVNTRISKARTPLPMKLARRSSLSVDRGLKACAEGEDDFERRLQAVQSAGRRMPKEGDFSGEKLEKPKQKSSNSYQKKEYDFSDEKIYYEGPPHRGDAIVNTALGFSLVWLPLTVASLTRAASIKYVISDKRVSVITKAPWDSEETRVDAPFDQIKKVQSVGRGIGLWGDMAVTTLDNNVLEFRSLDNFREIEKYVEKLIPQKEDDFEEDYQTY